MSDRFPSTGQTDNIEHSDAAGAKKVVSRVWNGTNYQDEATPFFTLPYDQVVLTYTDSTKATLDNAVSYLDGVAQETIALIQGSTTDTYTRT